MTLSINNLIIMLFLIMFFALTAALLSIYIPLNVALGLFVIFVVALFFISKTKFTYKNVISFCFFASVVGNTISYTQLGIAYSILPYALRSFIFISALVLLTYLLKTKEFVFAKRNWDIWLFCIWLFISAPFGLSPNTAIIYSAWLIASLFAINYFVKFSYQQPFDTLKPIFIGYSILVLVSFATSVIGLDSSFYYRGSQLSWKGIFGNVNYFALVCTVSFSLALALLILNKKKSYNVFLYFILIVSGISSLMTFSRASILACAVSLIVYFLFSKMKFVKKALLSILLLITCVIFQEQIGFSDIASRMSSTTDDLGQRSVIWNANLNYIKENPILGTGLTGSALIPESYGFSAHNSFIQIISETGIVGTVIFSVILLKLLLDLLVLRKTNRNHFTISIVILSGIFINAMAESQMLLPSTAFFIPFWTLVFLTRHATVKTHRT